MDHTALKKKKKEVWGFGFFLGGDTGELVQELVLG